MADIGFALDRGESRWIGTRRRGGQTE